MLFLGTSAAITSTPLDFTPGETVIPAQKSITPVDDTVQVYINLGTVNDDVKKKIVTGNFGRNELGDISTDICKSNNECLPMSYSGPFFSSDVYGIAFVISDQKIRGVTFYSVKIRVSRPIHSVSIRWQNYSK